MAAEDVLNVITRATLVLVALVTIINAFRRRERSAVDTALMFSSLAVGILLQEFNRIPGFQFPVVSTLSAAVILAQPYLLLRLTGHLRPVSAAVSLVGAAGLLASWALVLLVQAPLPVAATLLIAAYFLFGEGYAAFAFVQGAMTTGGVTRRRLGMAAAGSGLLAAVLLLAALGAAFPSLIGLTQPVSRLLAAVAAVAYFVAFAPPDSLRQTWYQAEAYRYLREIGRRLPAERAAVAMATLCVTATRMVGARATALVLWDQAGQTLRVRATDDPSLSLTDLRIDGRIGEVWRSERAALVRAGELKPNEADVAVALGGNALLLVPVATASRTKGLLVAGIRGSLPFLADDLGVLSILAEQCAIVLENEDLLTEQQDLIQRLEAANDELAAASRNLVNTIYSNVSDPLYLLTVEPGNRFRFQSVNDAFLQTTGLSYDQVIGQQIVDVLPAASHALVTGKFREAVATGLTLRWEEDTVFPAGRRIGAVSVTPVQDEHGNVSRLVGSVRDVTAERETREALANLNADLDRRVTERTKELELANAALAAANQAKSEFLSRMSHELRTPLNAVLGFAQLLEMDQLSSDQRESVEHIARAGRHLLQLINEVLDIARIEAGNLELSLEPVAVGHMLEDALTLVRPLADKAGLTLYGPATGQEALFVLADRSRLHQVMLNLLSNAIKYNRPGGTVTVSFTVSADRVRIEVADSGLGIPEHRMAELFEPFNRLGAERTDIEGSGIGLAVTQRLVQALGGTIEAHSVLGEGTTFLVDLPSTAPPEPQPVDVAPTAPQTIQLLPFTILYVEDNLSNLSLVTRLMERWPQVELLTAMQGRIGLELAQQHLPDLILLDLHLPDLWGDQVLARLKAEEQTRGIPVVMLSADASPHRVQRLMEQGARAYLTKPLDLREFIKVIDHLLRERYG